MLTLIRLSKAAGTIYKKGRRDYCQRYRWMETNLGSVDEKMNGVIEGRVKERGAE